MSSTGRGTKRIDADFYPTPIKSFLPLIPYLPRTSFIIWEPACGDGRLIKELLRWNIPADGNDLNNGYDFLQDNSRRECIVTNPPFSIAQEFIRHSVDHSNEVFLLLRLNFLGAKCRKAFWQKYKPSALFILSERPNFVMSVKCIGGGDGIIKVKDIINISRPCGYKELIPIDNPRPKACPKCMGNVSITSSDSCEYAWFYWGNRYKGFEWL